MYTETAIVLSLFHLPRGEISARLPRALLDVLSFIFVYTPSRILLRLAVILSRTVFLAVTSRLLFLLPRRFSLNRLILRDCRSALADSVIVQCVCVCVREREREDQFSIHQLFIFCKESGRAPGSVYKLIQYIKIISDENR